MGCLCAFNHFDPLGGHFVTGHVDAVGKVRAKVPEGDTIRFEIDAPQEVLMYLVDKGSVTVDGVSLTVVKVMKDYFTLVIIPHTAEITTLATARVGEAVNLEADIIGKYVYRYMNRGAGGASLEDSLRQGGFM